MKLAIAILCALPTAALAAEGVVTFPIAPDYTGERGGAEGPYHHYGHSFTSYEAALGGWRVIKKSDQVCTWQEPVECRIVRLGNGDVVASPGCSDGTMALLKADTERFQPANRGDISRLEQEITRLKEEVSRIRPTPQPRR